ncbi:hypothetical protein K3495_g3277 [Podosphaera aphanis]|nr:hypothetical protein K3495_g3277 [Podosphaera aphanis]
MGTSEPQENHSSPRVRESALLTNELSELAQRKEELQQQQQVMMMENEAAFHEVEEYA